MGVKTNDNQAPAYIFNDDIYRIIFRSCVFREL